MLKKKYSHYIVDINITNNTEPIKYEYKEAINLTKISVVKIFPPNKKKNCIIFAKL